MPTNVCILAPCRWSAGGRIPILVVAVIIVGDRPPLGAFALEVFGRFQKKLALFGGEAFDAAAADLVEKVIEDGGVIGVPGPGGRLVFGWGGRRFAALEKAAEIGLQALDKQIEPRWTTAQNGPFFLKGFRKRLRPMPQCR